MHYRCEVVIPPVDDVEKAVEQILTRFREDNEEGFPSFWDWYVIGGRWEGAKTDGQNICLVRDVPESLTCYRFIVGGEQRWGGSNKFEAKWMVERQYWNGTGFIDTVWDGSFSNAVKMYNEKRKSHTWCDEIEEDWLVVTVDYHS